MPGYKGLPHPPDAGRRAFLPQAEGWSVAFLVEVDDTQTVNFELVYDWGAWCCAPHACPQPTPDARPRVLLLLTQCTSLVPAAADCIVKVTVLPSEF